MKHRLGAFLAFVLAAVAICTTSASAKTMMIDHGGSYFGENVVVSPDQVVQGDVTVFGGNAIVEGEVDGDVTVFGGAQSKRRRVRSSPATSKFTPAG